MNLEKKHIKKQLREMFGCLYWVIWCRAYRNC